MDCYMVSRKVLMCYGNPRKLFKFVSVSRFKLGKVEILIRRLITFLVKCIGELNSDKPLWTIEHLGVAKLRKEVVPKGGTQVLEQTIDECERQQRNLIQKKIFGMR
jgi:hypothetical protein